MWNMTSGEAEHRAEVARVALGGGGGRVLASKEAVSRGLGVAWLTCSHWLVSLACHSELPGHLASLVSLAGDGSVRGVVTAAPRPAGMLS